MLYRGGIFLFAVFIMILSDKITSKKITKVSYKTRSLRGNLRVRKWPGMLDKACGP